MSKVVLDEALKSKLNGLTEPTEVCDEAGRTVGQFLPQDLYRDLIVAWSKTWISDEELERLEKQQGGRPLVEIWKDLGRS